METQHIKTLQNERKDNTKKNKKSHVNKVQYNISNYKTKMHKKLVKHITAKYVQLLQQKNQT